MRVAKIILFGLTVFFIQLAIAQPSPLPMLEQTANQIVTSLKQDQAKLKTNPQLIHQAIEHYLLPHVNVEGMSRSVLGRQAWSKASAADRRAFANAFTQLVIRTYATPLAEYSGETISFAPFRGQPNAKFSRVNSVISRPNGQRIPLSYSLVVKQGQWKIYDLGVEGVSLLQSFKSQFAQALQTESIKELVNRMQQHKAA